LEEGPTRDLALGDEGNAGGSGKSQNIEVGGVVGDHQNAAILDRLTDHGNAYSEQAAEEAVITVRECLAPLQMKLLRRHLSGHPCHRQNEKDK